MNVLGRMALASRVLLLPRRSDTRAAAPCPTSMPKAPNRFIIGKVRANPEMAIAPTP